MGKSSILLLVVEQGIQQIDTVLDEPRIVLRIDVYVSILLPGYSTVTQVTNEITVAETVIVGEVPGTYTYFATDPDAYAGDAKDYILNKD